MFVTKGRKGALVWLQTQYGSFVIISEIAEVEREVRLRTPRYAFLTAAQSKQRFTVTSRRDFQPQPVDYGRHHIDALSEGVDHAPVPGRSLRARVSHDQRYVEGLVKIAVLR